VKSVGKNGMALNKQQSRRRNGEVHVAMPKASVGRKQYGSEMRWKNEN